MSGQRGVLEALVRRLTTPRGALFYDSNYGFDVRRFLNASLGQGELVALQNGVEGECEKEERVVSARCFLSTNATDARLGIEVESQFGAFAFTLGISSVSVDLLTTSAA